MSRRREQWRVTETPDDDGGDPLVGDRDGISVSDGEEFDYVLSRPGGEEFGFDAAEISEIRELLDHMQGLG